MVTSREMWGVLFGDLLGAELHLATVLSSVSNCSNQRMFVDILYLNIKRLKIFLTVQEVLLSVSF